MPALSCDAPARPPAEDFLPLVHSYYQPLLRFALNLTRDEAQAADLTQQTFYLWALHGHQLRDRGKARGWLYTTLHREFLRDCRRGRRFQPIDASGWLESTPSSDPTADQAVDSSAVLRAAKEIAEPFRAPLLLFYLESLSYQEIAAKLRVPVGTVMSRLSRAKAQLRARLQLAPAAGAC